MKNHPGSLKLLKSRKTSYSLIYIRIRHLEKVSATIEIAQAYVPVTRLYFC